MTVTKSSGSPSFGDQSRDDRGRQPDERQPAHDIVAEADEDSFPASDAPGWTTLTAGPPAREQAVVPDRPASGPSAARRDEDPAMCNDPSRIIVTEVPCDACSTPTVQVHHQDFPELRIEGTSAEQAASHLADRLTNDLDTVSDSSHREAAQVAIDDARAFLDRGEAASPRPTRDVSKPSTS